MAEKREASAGMIERIQNKISAILTAGEEILAVASQNTVNSPVLQDCAVVTNRRFLIYRPKMFGRMDLQDVLWQDVNNVNVSTKMLGAIITVEGQRQNRDGSLVPVALQVDGLEKQQALELYGKAQEIEMQWREKNRVRRIEEERARAGGVYLGGGNSGVEAASASGSGSIEDRLQRLKELYGKGLISDAEYESRKAQIISEL